MHGTLEIFFSGYLSLLRYELDDVCELSGLCISGHTQYNSIKVILKRNIISFNCERSILRLYHHPILSSLN